jgi:glycosyltransferase involved in cell wall biosynthesis
VERLSRLVDDTALRRRMGASGRARVVADYSVTRWRDTLVKAIRDAASVHRRGDEGGATGA